MNNTIYIVRKLDDPKAEEVARVMQAIRILANQVNINIIKDEDEDQCNEDTLFIAIGGDGTVIYAAKLALKYDAHVIGFNLGKVGFLADFNPAQVYSALVSIFAREYTVDPRMLVEITIDGHTHPEWLALNDFVISSKFSDTTLKYNLRINDVDAGNHTANGVIVSTPTGSTAYALAVGGSIVEPTADAMQVLPIAAQTMTTRPLIVNGTSDVQLVFPVSKARPVTIRADGQVVASFESNEEAKQVTVRIRAYHKKVRVLHPKDWNYYNVLTAKLYWNR